MHTGLSRLAPSPSGRIHLGNIFSFLLTWADARKNADRLVLRMDDLDERCKNKQVQSQLISDLHWLGIEWDGKVVYQSKRVDCYEDAFNKLVEKNLVYPCFCSRADLHSVNAPHASDGTPVYSGKCKSLSKEEISSLAKSKNPSWRTTVPDLKVNFTDEVFGEFSQNLKKEVGDFIIRRSDEVFAYQLTSAVDDAEMGVTRVMRGCDLLSSTPRQLWLLREMDKRDNFSFAHLPMLVNKSGQRLAKRDKSLDLGSMQASGITSSMLRGKVAHLAGFIDKDSELTKDEFIRIYDVNSLKKCKSIIEITELND